MRKLILKTLLLYVFFASVTAMSVNAATYYVSSGGSASNTGTTETTPTTLASVYSKADNEKEVILLDDITYTNASSVYSGKVIIKGKTTAINLTLPSTVSLKGDLEFDNLNLKTASTIYANGKHLKIGSSVTATDRLTVFGGGTTALTADTDIELLGGRYNGIYGGCQNATLTGNTNVVLGGNANIGESISDSDSNASKCYVYGGGSSGAVTGKTNVTLQDNAVALYIYGTGTNAGANVKETNVYIKGGSAMNVYGGAPSQEYRGDTHVTMTGGKVEAIFGGCAYKPMTGNTYVSILGGEITRRVYTGCYNDAEVQYIWNIIPTSLKYTTDYYVTGTTTLTIAPGVEVNTKSGLSGLNNNMNVGVFSGSRSASQHDAEQNTIIYLDNCYSTYSGKIGEKGGTFASYLKSFEDYVVKSGTGGKVSTTGTKGKLYIEPDKGNYGAIGSIYYINETASISSGTTTVAFAQNFGINSVNPATSENGLAVTVGYAAKNVKNENSPKIFVAVFDSDTKQFVGGDMKEAQKDATSMTFDVSGDFEIGKEYDVKAMIWDFNSKPLTDMKSVTISR